MTNQVYRSGILSCAVFFLFLLPCLFARAQQKSTAGDIKKSSISFRIGTGQSLPGERFSQLLDLFDKYKGVTDDITFFSSITHPPLPLDSYKQRMVVLKQRMEQARKRGYRTGINILSSIGHHNENLENSLHGEYTHVTDIEGKISNGSYCPNDERVRQYIKAIYTATALANPDYIWLDDDIRLAGHGPVGLTCFCDNCLSVFAKEYGTAYTRESLKKAINEGNLDAKLLVRNNWLQHNRNTIANLFRLIEKTVHDLKPQLSLGFMTGDRFFEGYDFANWKNDLAGANKVPVMWRPGGGYYQDFNTTELAGKSHDIGRQVSVLPDDVTIIQSEIENFPYQRLKKAASMVALEASSHIAAGCTGAAFNVLSFYNESLSEYEPLVKKLHETRPFFDLMAKTMGRSRLQGVFTFWNSNSFASVGLEKGNWFASGNPVNRHELYDIGLPAAYSGQHAAVTVLSKDNAYALSKKDLEKILAGGVFMDAEALQQLNDMGYGELTGFKVIKGEAADRIEKFSDHPVNGSFSGSERDNRQSFYVATAYSLQKTNEKAEVLSGLIDYSGKEVSDVAMGIYENKLGGRICVSGYYPWTFMGNLSKSTQIKSVLRWLSRETIPGYISSFHKTNLWIREPMQGKIALAVTNSSFDPAEGMTLMLKTASKILRVYDMQCGESIVRSEGAEKGYQKFVLPDIGPWQMRLAVTGE